MARLWLVPGWLVPKDYTAWVPLPGIIFWDKDKPLDHRLLAHELVHVSQWNRYGLTLPFRYIWQSRLPHRKRPLEMEAWRLAETARYQMWADKLFKERSHDGSS